MNIRCKNCNSQFNIADHKLPKGRDAVFNCPKCREKIQIPAADSPAQVGTKDVAAAKSRSAAALQQQEKTLIMVSEGPFLKPAIAAVRQLGYGMETAADPADAVKKMAYHVYPLMVLENSFDQGQKNILKHMNNLDMSVRRKTCLILLGRQFKTGDPMAALHASVNFVAGPDSLDHLQSVLSAALMEHKDFYRVYMDSMKAAGKA
ncbi:MAG: zinc-ribbon domain-containing protein [Desulfotignum sp.]|nr:zinc-ribbon domain-containing protein [Desulfotignum sp.]